MWKKLPLHWKIIVGLILGTGWAFLSGFLGWNTFTANWIDPFGTIFIRILKYIAVPLVLFSIVTGVANLPDISRLGKMGAKTLAIYLVTTLFSVTLGLVLVNLFQPGKHADESTRQESRLAYEIWALDNQIEFKDDRREWQQVDEEKLQAVRKKLDAEREDSGYREVEKKQDAISSKKSEGPLQPLIDLVPENIFVSFSDGKLMLQVIFFALFFGIVLALLPADKTKRGDRLYEWDE
jgi:Na+/H+-dicarboxylate symporter